MTTYHFQLEDNEKREVVTEEDFVSIAGSCVETGDSFYQLAFLGFTNSQELMMGAATHSCLAFSCELYLKALLYAERSLPKRMHDLDQLYDALKKETQEAIYALHPKGNCPSMHLPGYFYLQIKELRKGFEVLRYQYELKGLACNMQFLMELADTLRLIAAEKCNELINKVDVDCIGHPEETRPFMFSRTLASMGLYCCKVDSEAYRLIYG